jgi:hypothetical protein
VIEVIVSRCIMRSALHRIDRMMPIPGVVQNSPFLGYTGEREPPSFEAGFWFRN